ncbi:MAG TPA: hypothetical protein VFS52_19745 [Steroidobacteraceae bacterium]|jgi:hypothetical protein|nr:hypothetical protein [Steroidobacteraceae bacterium]
MTSKKPWQPRLETLPLFNPFEPSTKWTEQIGADDSIEIDAEEDGELGNRPVPTKDARETN